MNQEMQLANMSISQGRTDRDEKWKEIDVRSKKLRGSLGKNKRRRARASEETWNNEGRTEK